VLTLNAITNGVAIASGDAAIARILKSDGSTMVMEGLTVGDATSSAAVKLNQTGTTISSGQTVIVDSATITEGNA
jgi:hypothetical protein